MLARTRWCVCPIYAISPSLRRGRPDRGKRTSRDGVEINARGRWQQQWALILDDGEFVLERLGCAEGIQSQKLLDAISDSTRSRTGAHGAITLVCLEWTGESEPVLVVDWAVIRNVA